MCTCLAPSMNPRQTNPAPSAPATLTDAALMPPSNIANQAADMFKRAGFRVLMLIASLGCAPWSLAQTLSPPSVQLIDEFGVNLMSGQVNQSLATVSIGGAMGISH